MINVQIPAAVGRPRAAARTWRPAGRAFWLMLAVEGALLVAALTFLAARMPALAPLARTDDVQRVREYILADDPADKLIEVAPGVLGRASNVRGLRVDGETYYYYFDGKQGYDPLSRHSVTSDETEVLLRDDGGDQTLVIYRLTR